MYWQQLFHIDHTVRFPDINVTIDFTQSGLFWVAKIQELLLSSYSTPCRRFWQMVNKTSNTVAINQKEVQNPPQALWFYHFLIAMETVKILTLREVCQLSSLAIYILELQNKQTNKKKLNTFFFCLKNLTFCFLHVICICFVAKRREGWIQFHYLTEL